MRGNKGTRPLVLSRLPCPRFVVALAAAGVQWPYKRVLMLDTYYLRQNCTTCSPAHLNVAGLTLNFYLRNRTERR